ncbi:MAG: sigma-54-dependent Fis family transcriptional regulator [Prolixibacteraceae bacterium]|nr:sigma-54-dependent Fis family transcriptional regulator [Prolixibacteraceae bacterium]MBN2745481.1 sigma-54-dependent Fis family transcriptional regulator [Bacteroidales bacterium]
MRNILIIDDEEKLRNLLTKIISYEGFKVHQASNCKMALKILEQFGVDVVICDVKLPDGNGVELSKEIKNKYPVVEIILLTAYGNIPDGVQAIKNGAFDYITKGDDNNKIIPLLYRAIEKVELAKRVQHLEKQLGEKYSFEKIIGTSKLIQNAIFLARKVADSDTTVLLTGETGTGKEVFAQAIHQESSRRNKNFVAINCSAFSRDLLESEFFGHQAGAFSGAIKDHKGLFYEANNGTIFLDEIGELALDLQAKLLRVIETGEFFKVGESKATKVNVRIIAATNRDLQKEIESGNFREDLFYRISAFQINLPALHERVIDIEFLANHFIQMYSIKANKKVVGISDDCINALKLHQWKGNIRELRNVMERCVILAESTEITADLLPMEIQRTETLFSKNKPFSTFELASAEKLHIQKVLNHTNGNKTKTAQLLNIALTTLYRKIEDYNL